MVGRVRAEKWRSKAQGNQVFIKILYKNQEVVIKLDDLAKNIAPYLESFRKDYAEGKVVLADPQKNTKA